LRLAGIPGHRCQKGLSINNPEQNHHLQHYRGGATVSALQVVCILHVGMQLLLPGQDAGIDLHDQVVRLSQCHPPRLNKAGGSSSSCTYSLLWKTVRINAVATVQSSGLKTMQKLHTHGMSNAPVRCALPSRLR